MTSIVVRLAVVLSSVVMVAAGCTARLVDFTMISTKNVDLTKGASFVRGPSRVEGSDKVHIIIIIPTGTPNMKEAIDRAIESVPGAIALMDGVVSQRAWTIPLIYGQSMFIVEGTPLVDPALRAGATIDPYVVARLDREGNVVERRAVSQSEFEQIRSNDSDSH